MGKIVCLMGKSSSGKNTIYKKLLEHDELGLKEIVPYTTRPIRSGEQEGIEYHFVDEAAYNKLLDEGKIVESREYHTCHGLWRYFTVADKNIDLDSQSYIMIGTIEAYEKIGTFYGEDKVLPVMIELDDGIRLQRALNREKAQANPRYEEMCRRFLADLEDFSEEKMANAGITQTFSNRKLRQCLKGIIEYLQENC
ncbi:MAG: guanylate kinase [Butyrivibrio sp.]|nr:guanylate kinase [Butyrivibrio sp.]